LPYDEFGATLAVWDTDILVGVPKAPAGGTLGAAYFFSGSGSNWTEQQKFTSDNTQCCDEFGSSVALRENLAIVGSRSHRTPDRGDEITDRQGRAFAYARSGSTWSQSQGQLLANDGTGYDWFGTDVDVSGSTVMVGAPGAESVYFFSPLTSSAVQDRIGTRDAIEALGGSLAFDGDVGVIGTEFGKGAFAAQLLVPDGGACVEDAECRARHCVAGVCCDSACSGPCEECSTGLCTARPGASGTPTCSPYLCGSSSGQCPMSCSTHAGCAEAFYCLNRSCVPRVPNGGDCTDRRECVSETCIDGICRGSRDTGSSCSRAVDCKSGYCVDGYCCNERCRGQCEACDVRDAEGTCSPVEGAPHGERAPCDGDGTDCDGRCDGEHTVSCYYPTSRQSCGSSCENGEQTNRTCDGQGACAPADPSPCEPYVCADAERCGMTCEGVADCAEGFTCLDGSCEAGSTCRDDDTVQKPDGTEQECAPYLCLDGSCGDSCDRPEDCSGDYACVDGRCVEVPAPSEVSASDGDGGCGCHFAKTRSPHVWMLLGLVGVFACVRRRASRMRACSIVDLT
jgi:hypothetical protein